MKEFLEDVLSMSPRKYNRYWRRKLFSGKGHPPVEIESDRKTLDYVTKTNGAIGIINNLPKTAKSNLYFFKPSTDGHTLNYIN